MPIRRINIKQAKELLINPASILLDIRDIDSYNDGHVENAVHLTETILPHFLENTNKTSPILVMCYHGNSSQNTAHFLSSEGFIDVYSIDGGYEAWINE